MPARDLTPGLSAFPSFATGFEGGTPAFEPDATRGFSRTVTLAAPGAPGRGGTAGFDEGSALELGFLNIGGAFSFSFSCTFSAARARALAVVVCTPPDAVLACRAAATAVAATIAPLVEDPAPCEDASFFAFKASSRSFAAATAACCGTAGVDWLVEMTRGRIGPEVVLGFPSAG